MSSRAVIVVLTLTVAAAGLAVAAGPRVPIDTTISFDPATIGTDLDIYLAEREARFSDLRPGLEKQIVWADPQSRAKTPLAIVYVHGFSASPGELRPLPDRVAERTGANLYFTRLTGHGRSGPAMAEASVNAWINDIAEALAIGRRLGERVVVIATSTGATLATYAAAHADLGGSIAALVAISANYALQTTGSFILTMPWAGQIARLLIGPTRSFTPVNERHARYWTSTYPTDSLLPMAALIRLTGKIDPGDITVPALFLYSGEDRIIRPDAIKTVARRWGGRAVLVDLGQTGDPMNHVIAGDALSPETTGPMVERIVAFVDSLERP